MDFGQMVLRADAAGMPLEWIDYQHAARLHHAGQVAYTCGSRLYTLHGGINALTGRRTRIDINSIIATYGTRRRGLFDYTPPLNNTALFRRDGHLCMYCGERFHARDLSRDHIRPVSQGGADEWSNVITACKRCNHHKAGRTPEQAGMELLAVPFKPTHAEYVYLQGRRVLSDQMDFLRAHFPRTSPLRLRDM
ncbi:HNH endonuclease [Acidihalobacter ferrooxydans]|uniref:HNH endonuclease n=1 Tax=Acidihalobacter ferrooxydans TaxID=1765967 RepID=A0A1P8UIA1_9GAMM|nr:HNH endonuclease [Acidihalobacter ferrooxydans]APZ43562.1 HNH endonuclease [Acidihalobacter ferrooxydans]